jgi:predicted transcriptional regulator
MAATISAKNIGTTIILPRTLRAEVQAIQERTGASLGEIARIAIAAYVEAHKDRLAEIELEQ